MFRSSDPGKPAEWRARFERFTCSGLAVASFCAREGVSVASFYLWRKKLRVKARTAAGPVPGRRRNATGPSRHRPGPTDGCGVFQRVAVVPAGSEMKSAAQAVSIHLPCGTRMEVAGEDIDALRTVVAEVLRAGRGVTTMQADADRNREAGAA